MVVFPIAMIGKGFKREILRILLYLLWFYPVVLKGLLILLRRVIPTSYSYLQVCFPETLEAFSVIRDPLERMGTIKGLCLPQ